MLWDYTRRASPTLVARDIQVNRAALPQAMPPVMRIEGRQEGILSWLMVVLGIDTSVILFVSTTDVELRMHSLLNGFVYRAIPLSHVATVEGGFVKPWPLLVFALGAALGGAVTGWSSGRWTFLLIGLILAVICIVIYTLQKTMSLTVEATSGSWVRIQVKRSIIEEVVVSEQTAEMLVDAVRAMAARSRGIG